MGLTGIPGGSEAFGEGRHRFRTGETILSPVPLSDSGAGVFLFDVHAKALLIAILVEIQL